MELLFDQHDQLEGVDRVQAQALDKDRFGVLDALGRDAFELQTLDQQMFRDAS